MKPIILFVDDDRAALESTVRAVAEVVPDVTFLTAASSVEARHRIKEHHPLVVVIDLCLEGEQGVESGYALLSEVAVGRPPCRTIVLTGHGTSDYGIRALNLGASSFIQKPAEIPHLAALLRDGITQAGILREFAAIQSSLENVGLVGESTALRRSIEEMQAVAPSHQAVLLLGETGTGKGVAARAIHHWSGRTRGKLVRYQPTFATPDIVQSDLFGHTKGAFTGATGNRRGLFTEADGGTLFLDEIDELPREIQVTLLGVLQDKRFRPVGSTTEQSSHFRLITASNRDLDRAVADGKLRPDLLHRIAHTAIRIPPLRERLEDIPLLVYHILNRLASLERLDLLGIEDGVLPVLTDYRWPGNIRELEGVIESAAFRAKAAGRDHIAPSDIRFLMSPAIPPAETEVDFHSQVEAFKRELVGSAMRRSGGNQLRAATDLGIDRGTLGRILKGGR